MRQVAAGFRWALGVPKAPAAVVGEFPPVESSGSGNELKLIPDLFISIFFYVVCVFEFEKLAGGVVAQ